MRIFISHPIDDEDLAIKLKQILESSDKIEIAHIAQKEKKYDLEISEKITNQIQNSDYIVALITENSLTSASVNQELGFAQGIEKYRIPLIEESAKKGFLIYGKDVEEFNRDNFESVCKKILDHIIEKGTVKRKPSKEEEENRYYKIELLREFHSISNTVFQAIFQLQIQSKPQYRDDTDLNKILNELKKNYEYTRSEIEQINSNTYIPAPIRSSVKVFINQAIKPISFPTIPPEFRFIEATFITPLKYILETDYFVNDDDSEIKKLRTDLLEYFSRIKDLINS